MIEETWVINASPLILLGKLGRIDLLEQLTKQIMVPQAVLLEVASGGTADTGIGDTLVWARNRIVEDVLVPTSISGWDLGAGESQVLAHCLLGRYRAVLDDGEARAAAKVHSVPMVGSLGVILRARKAGLISAARPLVEQLVESGSYVSPELIRQALIKVDE